MEYLHNTFRVIERSRELLQEAERERMAKQAQPSQAQARIAERVQAWRARLTPVVPAYRLASRHLQTEELPVVPDFSKT